MQFACDACEHPAVTLPPELQHDALVCCQGCGHVIATWGEFKQRTTRSIMAETALAGCPGKGLSPDPLDLIVLAAVVPPKI